MNIETKFNVNDICWMMANNEPTKVVIKKIMILIWNNSDILNPIIETNYDIGVHPERKSFSSIINQHRLFKTKEELLQSL